VCKNLLGFFGFFPRFKWDGFERDMRWRARRKEQTNREGLLRWRLRIERGNCEERVEGRARQGEGEGDRERGVVRMGGFLR
jgi:hypothetical protein